MRGVEVDAPAGTVLPITALQVAVRCDHFHIAQLLLDAGADPIIHVRSCCSVFHDALTVSNSTDIVQMLIDRGADVNRSFNLPAYEDTGLGSAAERCYHEMIRILLKSWSSCQ
jgi:Ankyrin repeats (many copies)/Ankyrin repeat